MNAISAIRGQMSDRFRIAPALAVAVLLGLTVAWAPGKAEASEGNDRICISLNRAVQVAEGHRSSGANVTMLSKREEVDRWYDVVTESAGARPTERPTLIIVITYPEVTYAHIAKGGSVCDGVQMPASVAQQAMEAARGLI